MARGWLRGVGIVAACVGGVSLAGGLLHAGTRTAPCDRIELTASIGGVQPSSPHSSSLDRMTTPFKNDYAFGLVSSLNKGRRIIAHDGGIDGFNTSMAYYPDTRIVVIALSNVGGSAPGAITGALGGIAHGDTFTLTSERKAITVPAATLAKYVGEYQLAPAIVMTISLDGEQLSGQLTGQGKLPIFPESETMFFLKVVDAQIEFAPDASFLVLHQNGRDQKAPRK